MPQEITETAKLQCNQGTVTTTLKVTSQQFAKINDKLQATEEDKQANENKNHIPQGGNREIQSNGEYSFRRETTTNIMDYSDFRNDLFYWQIKIVRSKAAPEPNNYRPEQL